MVTAAIIYVAESFIRNSMEMRDSTVDLSCHRHDAAQCRGQLIEQDVHFVPRNLFVCILSRSESRSQVLLHDIVPPQLLDGATRIVKTIDQTFCEQLIVADLVLAGS